MARTSGFKSTSDYDPWAGVDELGEVDLRKIKGTSDALHDLQCSACGERTKTHQAVLGLLTMDGTFSRAVIHLTCLETYLDELPYETRRSAKIRERATDGLVQLEKDLAAKVR